MEQENKKTYCPRLDVDGVVSSGKQFDLDITLPEDNRDVIYGVVKNCFKEPVSDAVVKLVEIVCEHDKVERRPVGHTFTDKDGEFVFGPLCPGKEYAIQIWVNNTKKIKVCAKCHHEGKCLKGEKCDKCDCYIDDRDYHYDYDMYEKHDKCDKCDKYEKHEKCCKCDKDKKDDKDEKYDKYEKYEKYDKYDKEDKCDKDDKKDMYEKCDKEDKCEKHDKEDKHDKCDKDDKY